MIKKDLTSTEIDKGLIEKWENAKNLKLEKYGVKTEEELNSIMYPEEFNLKIRLKKAAEEQGVSISEAKLEPIKEIEKSEKFKLFEAIDNYEKESNINPLSGNPGRYVWNSSSSTIYTISGQPLYPGEVFVKFDNGGQVWMMKTNGSMGYDYLNSSQTGYSYYYDRCTANWTWGYGLRIRGSQVWLYTSDGKQYGYVDSADWVNDSTRFFYCGSSMRNLMSITHYKLYYRSGLQCGYGGMICKDFNGFIDTNITNVTHINNVSVY